MGWLDDNTRFLGTLVVGAPTLIVLIGTAGWIQERRMYRRWDEHDRTFDLLWSLGAARRDPHRLRIVRRNKTYRAQLDASWARLPAHRRRKHRFVAASGACPGRHR